VSYVIAFGRFWYDFVVGDDWTIAAAVAVALIAVGALSHAQIGAWWLLPVVVILFLTASLWRRLRAAT
jgi:fatty acid desaturase